MKLGIGGKYGFTSQGETNQYDTTIAYPISPHFSAAMRLRKEYARR